MIVVYFYCHLHHAFTRTGCLYTYSYCTEMHKKCEYKGRFYDTNACKTRGLENAYNNVNLVCCCAISFFGRVVYSIYIFFLCITEVLDCTISYRSLSYLWAVITQNAIYCHMLFETLRNFFTTLIRLTAARFPSKIFDVTCIVLL